LKNFTCAAANQPRLSIILLLPSVGDGVQTPGEISVILQQTTLTTERVLSRVHLVRYASHVWLSVTRVLS